VGGSEKRMNEHSGTRKVFSIKNCPYGFKRPACEDVCEDFEKCSKEMYKGSYPF
jgi:hypothetical protein